MPKKRKKAFGEESDFSLTERLFGSKQDIDASELRKKALERRRRKKQMKKG